MSQLFDVRARGPDGKVRVGVWDLVCVPGHDEKDGQSTDFNVETLSQMAANFAERADPIPIDYNHQSNHAAQNGQPAPALGFYGALAVVAGGQVVKLGVARETPPLPGSSFVSPSQASALEGLDTSRDGLWCFRSEVTELGEQLLPNFKLVSPTFMANGVRRDGTEVGYCLAAVAATNTPWQSGTEITFSLGAAGASKGAPKMAKLAKLAAFAGVGEDADDKAIKQGVMARMSKMAADVAMDEGDMFAYEDEASKLEDAAKSYEDAHFEDDGEDPTVTMRKMASKFRKLGKMAGGNSEGPRPGAYPGDPARSPAAAGAEPNAGEGRRTGDDNKMAVMQASLTATVAKLEKLEKLEAEREKVAAAEREQRFERLADAAIAGGYPKEARGALLKFARIDFEGARASVAHFAPSGGAPAHLFERTTRQGGPINGPTSAREDSSAVPKRKVVTNGLARWVEMDSGYADEIKRVAESTDPAVKAKVDKLLHVTRREVMFDRLQAAGQVVKAERPDLFEAAEAE